MNVNSSISNVYDELFLFMNFKFLKYTQKSNIFQTTDLNTQKLHNINHAYDYEWKFVYLKCFKKKLHSINHTMNVNSLF